MTYHKQAILLYHPVPSVVHIGDLGHIDVQEGIIVVCAPMGHSLTPQSTLVTCHQAFLRGASLFHFLLYHLAAHQLDSFYCSTFYDWAFNEIIYRTRTNNICLPLNVLICANRNRNVWKMKSNYSEIWVFKHILNHVLCPLVQSYVKFMSFTKSTNISYFGHYYHLMMLVFYFNSLNMFLCKFLLML